MSQIAMIASPGSVIKDVETLTGDTGGAVGVDAALNINIVGGVGINVDGNPATNTLTISDDDLVQGSVTTNDAAITTCLTFPLGAAPGTYVVEGRITGYNISDIAGGSYFFSAGARTTGLVGILLGSSTGASYEEAAMAAANFSVTVAGNDLIINSIGIAGKTINWSAEFEYQFVGV
jgi:hypothetical protein